MHWNKGRSLKVRLNKVLFLSLAVSLPLIFLHCTKYKEQSPFFDGMYLKYEEVFGDSRKHGSIIWTREIVYKFTQTRDGNFHISQNVNTHRGIKLNEKIEPPPFPQVGNYLTIDKDGKVLKSGDNLNFVNGYPSFLLLPPDSRKAGAEVIRRMRKVGEKTIWEGWEVWPVKGVLGDTYYYDAGTGFLLGAETLKGKLRMSLIDTNHERLKSAIQKSGKFFSVRYEKH